MFDESKHPRAEDGRFTDGSGTGKTYRQNTSYSEILAKDNKKALTNKIIKVDMNTQIQRQLNEAQSPKERQKIAYRYIMDNLRGKYTAPDGRTVSIEKVGADKITHRDIKVKLRVCPALADMIRAGEMVCITTATDKQNPKFVKFAYYKVPFQFGEDKYIGLLNVGIRSDGSSTLYDLNPFKKQ